MQYSRPLLSGWKLKYNENHISISLCYQQSIYDSVRLVHKATVRIMIMMWSIYQSMLSLFMSPSGDQPLNHSSALIGLNVGLLVDWQAASVLWFVDRWWVELKVSMVTSCVCVGACALNAMTVSLASRGQQPICFKQEWWENMTVIYEGKKWYYGKAFEVAKSQLQGQLHRWVIQSWMCVLWFKLCVTVTSFEFFKAKCVSRAPKTQNIWYLTTWGGLHVNGQSLQVQLHWQGHKKYETG